MNPTTYQTHALWQAINSIKIGKRFRKDLGDIDALARSINEVGLLHPIVITPDGELLAGQGRLEACKKLEASQKVDILTLRQRCGCHTELSCNGL